MAASAITSKTNRHKYPRKAKRMRNSSVSSSSLSIDSRSSSDNQTSCTNRNSLLKNIHERFYSLRKSTRTNKTNHPVLTPLRKSVSRLGLAGVPKDFGKNYSSTIHLLNTKKRSNGINKENEVVRNPVITSPAQLRMFVTPKRTKICPLSSDQRMSLILTTPKAINSSVSSPVTNVTPSPLTDTSLLLLLGETRDVRASGNSSYFLRTNVKRRSFEENCGCFSCYSSPYQSPPIKRACSTSRVRRKRKRKSTTQCDIDSLFDRSSAKSQKKTKVEKGARKWEPKRNKSAPAKMLKVPVDDLGSAFTPLGKRKFVASPKRIKARVPRREEMKKSLVKNVEWLKEQFPSKGAAGEDDAFRPCLFKPIPLLEYESDIGSSCSSPHSMAFSPALQRSTKRKTETVENQDLESLHVLRRIAQKKKLMEKVNVTSSQLSGESNGRPPAESSYIETKGLEKIVTQLQNIQDKELRREDDDDSECEKEDD